MTIRCTLFEFLYVSESSNKFYRVFTMGAAVAKQYGRTGTYGTWTAFKDYDDEAAAAAAADKESRGRIAKGYRVIKAAATEIDAPTVTDLDRWAATVDVIEGDGLTVPQPREQAAVMATVNEAPVQSVMDDVAATIPRRPQAASRVAVLPMLAHNAEPAQIEGLLTNPGSVMQPKLDGDRLLVEVVDGEVRTYGRNGQAKVSNVGADMLAPFRKLTEGRFVFDGEVVDGTLWLFDLPVAEEFLRSDATFLERYTVLTGILQVLGHGLHGLVPIAESESDKRAMLDAAQANRREGVMFRLGASRYAAGRSRSILKHKFVKTLDAVVTEVGHQGKSNATLSVFDPDTGQLVEVGRASTIGKGPIHVGHVVEVAFLYTVNPAAPRLYQPRIMRVRTDKLADECTTEQLIGTDTNKAVA